MNTVLDRGVEVEDREDIVITIRRK